MNTYWTIGKIHRAYREKKLSVTELTHEFLGRIRQSKHNAFVTVCEKEALKRAEELQVQLTTSAGSALDAKPLFGIPIGVKDIFTTQGIETTCASRMLKGYVPPYTATCVKKLEEAGAIVLGKLNMDEFAMGSSNENSAFGPVEHPTHPGHVPGGSSGGSAAAVRAGLCVAALGSDTGGSIRLPASFCGVVGLKPTYGRVSRYGLVAFASSMDQAGPLANSVEDTTRLLDVIAGHDPKDSTSALQPSRNWTQVLSQAMDFSQLQIGIPTEYFVDGMDPQVESATRDALRWFESKGARLVDISLPHTRFAIPTYYLLAVSEASSNLSRYDGIRYGTRAPDSERATDLVDFYKNNRSLFGAEVKRRIILGTFALSSGYYDAYYLRASRVRRLIQEDFLKAFEKVQIIAAPVCPTPAFKKGEKISDPLQMYLMDALTIPVNLAGLPALSVPASTNNLGLPIGLQLIGAPFREDQILRTASAFEKRGDSHES